MEALLVVLILESFNPATVTQPSQTQTSAREPITVIELSN